MSLAYAENRLQGYITSPPPPNKDNKSKTETLLMAATTPPKPGKQGETIGLEGEGLISYYTDLLEMCTAAKKESNK